VFCAQAQGESLIDFPGELLNLRDNLTLLGHRRYGDDDISDIFLFE
jgi:hypothetical protein